MKTIKFFFSDLNQDERQILGGVVTFIAGTIFMIWLCSTNSMPVLSIKKTDTQIEGKSTYKLPKLYTKYAEHCYTYGK